MTLKQEIAEFLTNNRGERFTNAQIANRLFVPQPSVRRATLQLVNAGKISEVGNSGAMIYTVPAANAD